MFSFYAFITPEAARKGGITLAGVDGNPGLPFGAWTPFVDWTIHPMSPLTPNRILGPFEPVFARLSEEVFAKA
jgi:hypothetical protein